MHDDGHSSVRPVLGCGSQTGSEAVLVVSEWKSVTGADEWGVLRDAAAVATALDRRGRHESALLKALTSAFELPIDVAAAKAPCKGKAAAPGDGGMEAAAEQGRQGSAGAAAVDVPEQAVKKQRSRKRPLQIKQPLAGAEEGQPAGAGAAATSMQMTAGQQGRRAGKGPASTSQRAATAKVAPRGQAGCGVAQAEYLEVA